MFTRRILPLIAATLIALTAALTIAGTTSGTASAMRIGCGGVARPCP